jgi:hypothetical protein
MKIVWHKQNWENIGNLCVMFELHTLKLWKIIAEREKCDALDAR